MPFITNQKILILWAVHSHTNTFMVHHTTIQNLLLWPFGTQCQEHSNAAYGACSLHIKKKKRNTIQLLRSYLCTSQKPKTVVFNEKFDYENSHILWVQVKTLIKSYLLKFLHFLNRIRKSPKSQKENFDIMSNRGTLAAHSSHPQEWP